jgi:hypothetical protein
MMGQPTYLTATDLRALKRLPGRAIAPSPVSFRGTLDELYAKYILPVMPSPETVRYYHALLRDYCRDESPLFLLRQVPGVERRIVHQSPSGLRYMWTDNSPAWFFHYLLFNDFLIEPESFATLVEATPSHFHDVAKLLPNSISGAGWYVAHIYRVKDGDTNYAAWGKSDLVRRFIRNVHPCNHFYVPKGEGRRLGEADRIIAQFAHWNAQRYAAVWLEFLALAQATPLPRDEHTKDIDCSFAPGATSAAASSPPPIASTAKSGAGTGDVPKVTYTYYRFGFKRREIEPLGDDDAFRMVTPVGTFQMTKAQFYATFPGVIRSRDYQGRGEYNWPKLPRIAGQFKVDV